MKEIISFFSNNLLRKGLLFTLVFTFAATMFAQEGEKKDMRYGGFARLYSMGDNPYIIDPDNINIILHILLFTLTSYGEI